MSKIETMTHRGIRGTVEPQEDGTFGGELLDVHDLAIYSGKDMPELERKFREMVDFHIETELAEGRDPYPAPEAMPQKAARA